MAVSSLPLRTLRGTYLNLIVGLFLRKYAKYSERDSLAAPGAFAGVMCTLHLLTASSLVAHCHSAERHISVWTTYWSESTISSR